MKIKSTEEILMESNLHRDFYENMESLSQQRKSHKWIAVDDIINLDNDKYDLHQLKKELGGQEEIITYKDGSKIHLRETSCISVPWRFSITYKGERYDYFGIPNKCATRWSAFMKATYKLKGLRDGTRRCITIFKLNTTNTKIKN